MKQLLTSVAVFAALALSAPVLAQQASPSSNISSATPPATDMHTMLRTASRRIIPATFRM